MKRSDLIEASRVNKRGDPRAAGNVPGRVVRVEARQGQDDPPNFVHIIWARASRIEKKFSNLRGTLPKLDWKTATREEIATALNETEALMGQVYEKRTQKPDRYPVLTFLAYMIAHESHHRSQIEITLRMQGVEPEGINWEMWEWEKK